MKKFGIFLGKAFAKLKSLFTSKKTKKEAILAKALVKKLKPKAKKTAKPAKQKPKTLMEKTFEQISMLLEIYENFIKKDFVMVIHEANAMLHSWKATIINAKTALNINIHDLNEIDQIYAQSEITLHNMINNCQEYQKIILNNKRLTCPTQKLAQIQTQLDSVINNLRKSLEMTDLERNSDYKYLSAYLQKNKEMAISRA